MRPNTVTLLHTSAARTSKKPGIMPDNPIITPLLENVNIKLALNKVEC